MKILMPLPSNDFDPSEAAITWKLLQSAGHDVIFSTPSGAPANGDHRMLNGEGLGLWKKILMASESAIQAYQEMTRSKNFGQPLKWENTNLSDFQALVLAGGHAPGMKEYLESQKLQSITAAMFADSKPVAAICHGVVLACRSKDSSGKSVLFQKKTTALLKSQEMTAWAMTSMWLGNYYRTYPESVQSEVTRNLENPSQFIEGPTPLFRDSAEKLSGFYVKDGNYLSARWPGDAYTFGNEFLKMLV